MDVPHIAARLEPFLNRELTPAQLDQISTYIDLLQRWNARINLTAIRDEEEIVTRHFGESLFLARHLFPSTSNPRHPERSGLDIGAGAGFPGVPIKIWAPDIHLTLIESNHKKTVFLREVARALILTDINVITGRAEDLAPHARKDFPPADVVTLRAIERFEKILPQAVTFMAPQARLALLIGAAQLPQLTKLTTLQWDPPIPMRKSNTRRLSIGVHR